MARWCAPQPSWCWGCYRSGGFAVGSIQPPAAPSCGSAQWLRSYRRQPTLPRQKHQPGQASAEAAQQEAPSFSSVSRSPVPLVLASAPAPLDRPSLRCSRVAFLCLHQGQGIFPCKAGLFALRSPGGCSVCRMAPCPVLMPLSCWKNAGRPRPLSRDIVSALFAAAQGGGLHQ